jgi:hypothetical protein
MRENAVPEQMSFGCYGFLFMALALCTKQLFVS